jgi:hypothetical protein
MERFDKFDKKSFSGLVDSTSLVLSAIQYTILTTSRIHRDTVI